MGACLSLLTSCIDFREGERVEVLDEEGGEWLAGVIKHKMTDADTGEKEYAIDYDDIDEDEYGVEQGRIRRASTWNDILSFVVAHSVGYTPGTRVEARRVNRYDWIPGTIHKVHPNGLYDVDYDDGPIEEGMGPSRIRLGPEGLSIMGGLRYYYESAFTKKGRLAAQGIDIEVSTENHTVPTRFKLGTKVLVRDRPGVFTVTGFAGSSDATVTLIGLRRDKIDARVRENQMRVAQAKEEARWESEEDSRKKSRRKKKSGSTESRDEEQFKAMQMYYPQASWRLSEVVEHEEGSTVFCQHLRDQGEDLEDKPLEKAIVVSKDAKYVPKVNVKGLRKTLLERVTECCEAIGLREELEFDPVHSSYTVQFANSGEEESLAAYLVYGESSVAAPLQEDDPLYTRGDIVTYASEGQDQWLEILSVKSGHITYNVVFEDGDKELNLSSTHVKKREKRFKVGDRVEVNYKSSGKLVPGEITEAYDDMEGGRKVTLYSVDYDIQDDEDDVPVTRIYKEEQPARLKRRESVFARRRSNKQWYAGTVTEVKQSRQYTCRYLYDHHDVLTGKRARAGDEVNVLEDDLDSPLKPMRYTEGERELYYKINIKLLGREAGEPTSAPPRVLNGDQRGELRKLCENNSEAIWNALDPQINHEIDWSFLHTVQHAQTDKRRKNYIDVTKILFDTAPNGVPIDAFNNNGLTPLYLACIYGDEDIAWHLVENGADALMPCVGLKSPAHIILDPAFPLDLDLLMTALLDKRKYVSLGGRNRRVHYNFALLNPSFYDTELMPTPNCFITDTDLGTDKKRHIVNGVSPMRMVVNEGLTEMMTVPIVKKLIDEMWSQFTFGFQLVDAIAAYTTIIFFLLVSTRIFGLAELNVDREWSAWDKMDWSVFLMMVVIILLVLMGTRDELLEMRRLGVTRYFSNQWNVIEVVSYLLLICTLAMDAAMLFNHLPDELVSCRVVGGDEKCFTLHDTVSLKRRLTAFAALFVWIRGLKYVTMFQSVGVLVRMVEKMLKEVFIFLVIFLFFVFGWAHAFTVIMADSEAEEDVEVESFQSFFMSIISCFRLSLGDFEMEDYTSYEGEKRMMIFLWVTFLMIGAVLMLNLLIAQVRAAAGVASWPRPRACACVRAGGRAAARPGAAPRLRTPAPRRARLTPPPPARARTRPPQLSNVYTMISGNVEAEYSLTKASIIFNTQVRRARGAPMRRPAACVSARADAPAVAPRSASADCDNRISWQTPTRRAWPARSASSTCA